MSKILANHPRLSKFVFGLFGAAGMIWLNKAFQGDELFQLITSLLALDTFVYFCIYSLINPIPEANDFVSQGPAGGACPCSLCLLSGAYWYRYAVS